MYDLEDMGYLKLDILGLKTLTVISKTHPKGVRCITKYDDPKVFKLISTGHVKGMFQVEKNLGQSWCKKLRPKNINELSDLIALIRPAPLETGLSEQYLKNKKSGSWTYLHDDLAPILDNTYGIMLFQEQMLEIVKKFAGFSLVEADLLRYAAGKKLPEKMKKYKDDFIKGCIKNNYSQEIADELWRWISATAEYSFNCSHSISYAILGYITMWLKLYYKEKFFLNMFKYSKIKGKQQEEISELFYDAKNFGIQVLPPNIHTCNEDFALQDGNVLFGLSHVKSIGKSSIKNIKLMKRQSWLEILETCLLPKDVMEALILSGAFDYLDKTRKCMLEEFEFFGKLTGKLDLAVFRHILFGEPCIKKMPKSDDKVVNITKAETFKEAVTKLEDFIKDKNKTLKFIATNRAKKIIGYCDQWLKNYTEGEEFNITEKAGYEQFYLGIQATCSNVDAYNDRRKTHYLLEIEQEVDNIGICTIAQVGRINTILDKKGRQMAFLDLEDSSFRISAILFAGQYEEFNHLLREGRVLLFEGVKRKDSLIINKIEILKVQHEKV
jgi:DNA polymerase III alpha subunit